jgi:hypothetical protein
MRTASSASLRRIQTSQKGSDYRTGRALPKSDISSATDSPEAGFPAYGLFVQGQTAGSDVFRVIELAESLYNL